MPVDPRVQAAHAKITHCTINNGYRYINGGVGKVYPIHIVHPMLINQAINSKQNRNGNSL